MLIIINKLVNSNNNNDNLVNKKLIKLKNNSIPNRVKRASGFAICCCIVFFKIYNT